ncbi:MAG: CBS domain-containing protein [Planctomycetota bacterium]
METMTGQKSLADSQMGRSFSDPRGLKVRAVMSREVVTAAVEETVSSVAKKMADNGVSCVVVTEGEHIRGIFTERDLVRGVTWDTDDVGSDTMSQRMSYPVETIALHVPILDAAERMQSRGIKRLPVVADDEMVGLVTQTDITRGLILLSPLRSVSDVMSDDVATVDVGRTVAEAAHIMSERDISCVVVLRESFPVGMVTEKDLSKYVIAAERKPSETLVVEVMSFPLRSVPPTHSVLSASQKMSSLRLHRLVVMDGDVVRGVVSQTDIMQAVRAELERVDTDRTAAVSAIADHVKHTRGEVAELGEFLRGCFADADVCDSAHATASRRVVEAEIAPRVQHIMDELTRL